MDEFERFEQSLTPAEREATHAWLGVWGEAIRDHQLNDGGCDRTCRYELNFSTALGKAVTCTDPVFRGLSTSNNNWRPERIDFLRGLIKGPEEYTLEAHASASTQEEIGRAFTRI